MTLLPIVHLDEHGVYRVGNSRVMLDGILHGYLQGVAPETMHEQFPAVSVEEIQQAIKFFLENRKEVTEYLDRQEAVWDYWKAKSEEQPNPVVERLRAMRHVEAKGQP